MVPSAGGGAVLALVAIGVARAADLYVPADVPTVGQAVALAVSGDVIHVAAGTHHESVGIDVVSKQLTVSGDPGAVLSSGGLEPGRALIQVREEAELTLEGVEIQSDVLEAILVDHSALTLRDVSIVRLWDLPAGGFLFAEGSTIIVSDTTFTGGLVLEGAAVSTLATTATFERVTVDHATVAAGSVFYASGGQLELLDSRVDGSSAGTSVAYTQGATVTIDGSEFTKNTSGGPLVYLVQAPLATVHANLWCDNDSGDRSVKFSSSPGAFTNNVVRNGTTAVYGVHAHGDTAIVAVTNNTIVGAESDTGGAALSTTYGGTIDARNNVVAFTTGSQTGALWSDDDLPRILFSYGLLYENLPEHATQADVDAATVLLVDPGFAPPKKGTCTIADLAPKPGSPLIDAGDPSILDPDGSVSDLGATGGPSPIELDADGDGYASGLDCDDSDPNVHPGAVELPCSGVDEDCLPETADDGDADQDGVSACADCDDADPTVKDPKPEVCDGKDQDCDGLVDEEATNRIEVFTDADGDGFGAGPATSTCDPLAGTTSIPGDCDDADASANPAAIEVRDDGVDQDCDGRDLQTTLGGAVGLACGCRSAAPSPGPWLLLALVALARRGVDRRSSTRRRDVHRDPGADARAP